MPAQGVNEPPRRDGTDAGCPFCAIVGGLDRSVEVVCEGEHWMAFFPPEPATPGHTLLIPRAHVSDFWSLEASLGGELAGAAIRVGQAIDAALSPEGMNLITSAGEAAEQTVFHVHLHVVPRWQRDGFGRIWPPETPMADDLRENVADLIREACSLRDN